MSYRIKWLLVMSIPKVALTGNGHLLNFKNCLEHKAISIFAWYIGMWLLCVTVIFKHNKNNK